MEKTAAIILCIMVTCSVWTVNGRRFEVAIDDKEQEELDISVQVGKLPGACWACKWALNKVKKTLSSNASAEVKCLKSL
ncbi:hypothetical protein INR49_019918 [Caranx melampygus]|nr:hypothetical protein INR49_019918 [Caranx melampygus]